MVSKRQVQYRPADIPRPGDGVYIFRTGSSGYVSTSRPERTLTPQSWFCSDPSGNILALLRITHSLVHDAASDAKWKHLTECYCVDNFSQPIILKSVIPGNG